jgi:hypothetical protein
MSHSGSIDTGRIFIYTAHGNSGTAGKGKTKGTGAVAGSRRRSIQLSGVKSVGGFKCAKGSAGISCILVLHARLIHHNGVAGRIECLTV